MSFLDTNLTLIDMILFIVFSVWSSYLTKGMVQWGRINIEFEIYNLIHGASQEVRSAAVALSDDPKNEVKAKVFEATMDDYRSACENACEKYVHRKVGKAWFKNLFSTEIKMLVESEAHSRFYTSPDSKFLNTIKVYREWFGAVTDRF